jgi:hypothetical protein
VVRHITVVSTILVIIPKVCDESLFFDGHMLGILHACVVCAHKQVYIHVHIIHLPSTWCLFLTDTLNNMKALPQTPMKEKAHIFESSFLSRFSTQPTAKRRF